MTLLAITLGVLAGFMFGVASKNDDYDEFERSTAIILGVASLIGAFACMP